MPIIASNDGGQQKQFKLWHIPLVLGIGLTLYTVFSFLVLEGVYDMSGKRWKAALTNAQREHVEQIRKDVRRVWREEHPLAIVEYSDGKLYLLYRKAENSSSNIIGESRGIWVINRYGEAPKLNISQDWDLIKISRIIFQEDPDFQRLWLQVGSQ